jgi:hypothetical protein
MLGNNTQAGRIIKKAGGARALSRMIDRYCDARELDEKRHPSAIYRWNYPKDKGGTGGDIPSSCLKLVAKALRREGIFLTERDLLPEVYPEG